MNLGNFITETEKWLISTENLPTYSYRNVTTNKLEQKLSKDIGNMFIETEQIENFRCDLDLQYKMLLFTLSFLPSYLPHLVGRILYRYIMHTSIYVHRRFVARQSYVMHKGIWLLQD